MTSSSSPSVSLAASSTKTITLTGTGLVDGSNFAEVALTHTITKAVTVISADTANSTTVTFTLTASSLVAGTYDVSVRNSIGGTNSLAL